jgi:membrane-bound lytic murein transglycosylase A
MCHLQRIPRGRNTFLDPSHSFGMTGLSPSPWRPLRLSLRLILPKPCGGFARDFQSLMRFKVGPLALLFFLLVRIAHGEPTPVIGISDDLDRESLRGAIRQSLAYLTKLPPEAVVGERPRRLTAKQVLDSLVAFEKTLDLWDCAPCWRKEITGRFELVASSNEPETESVLFTGYFQPLLDASLSPTAEYRYPIYGKPADLVIAEQVTLAPQPIVETVAGRLQDENFVPYYSRREIDDLGMLRGRGHEIAWLKDPIDLFFLHIQGSGILRLQDGRRLQVGYAASNGRPYRSIGRLLIENGNIPREEMSMQRLRRYLMERPHERSEVMAYNESYVFFRVNESGPLGSLEVPLTAGRSIATDSRIFPKGALAFVMSERPIIDNTGQLTGWQPFARFVLNQDTGGAIRGLQRADLYFGAGEVAGGEAGFMNRQGKLYFVLLKEENRAETPAY